MLLGARNVSFYAELPDGFWGPYSLRFNGYRGSNPGVKRSGHEVNSDLHLVPRGGMSGAKTLLPVHAFMPRTGKTLLFAGVIYAGIGMSLSSGVYLAEDEQLQAVWST
jgi:hypothetical protein